MLFTSNFDIFSLIADSLDFRVLLHLRLVCHDWKNSVDIYLKNVQTIKIVTCQDDLLQLTSSVSELSVAMGLDPLHMLYRSNIVVVSPHKLNTNLFTTYLWKCFPNIKRLFFYIKSQKSRKISCLDYCQLFEHWKYLTTLMISHIDPNNIYNFVRTINKCQRLIKLIILEENDCFYTFRKNDRIIHQLERLFLPIDTWLGPFTPKYLRTLGFGKILQQSNLQLLSSLYLNLKTLHLPLQLNGNSPTTSFLIPTSEFIDILTYERHPVSSVEFSSLIFANEYDFKEFLMKIDKLESLTILKLSFVRFSLLQLALKIAKHFRFIEILHIDILPCGLFNHLSRIDFEYFPKSMKNIRKIIIRSLNKKGFETFCENDFSSLDYQVEICPLVDLAQIKTYPLPRIPGKRLPLINY